MDWQPIETAPKDDFIDIWCVSPDGERGAGVLCVLGFVVFFYVLVRSL